MKGDKSEFEKLCDQVRAEIRQHAKAEGWRVSETVMALTDVPKRVRNMLRRLRYREKKGRGQ